jgi:proteic killer suppression protein
VIQTFADRDTEELFRLRKSRRIPPAIQRVALRKLAQIHAVYQLRQLSVPPGNHLEALKGKRAGQHSIRINDQWRICFVWKSSDAYDVEITDYH